MKKLLIVSTFCLWFVHSRCVICYKLPEIDELRHIVFGVEEKFATYSLSTKMKPLAKRLADKSLVLHKDIVASKEELRRIAHDKNKNLEFIKECFERQCVTPFSLERRVNIAVFFAYPQDKRRPQIAASIIKTILESYPDAYREYRFLKDNNIAEFEYEKNPGKYTADYEIWLHYQLEPR